MFLETDGCPGDIDGRLDRPLLLNENGSPQNIGVFLVRPLTRLVREHRTGGVSGVVDGEAIAEQQLW